MQDLAGKAAIVTGAARGIGAAVARRLAAAGTRVVVADLDGETAAVLATSIDGLAVTVDVTDPASVEAMVQACVTRFGSLDIAVNNAGVGAPAAATADYPIESWNRIIAVNLTGVFLCMRSELAVMRQAGRGSIINIASTMAKVAFPDSPAYVASKHGVLGLTKAAALDHAGEGIRVNAVGPTFVLTELLKSNMDAGALDALAARHPNGRLGTPEEVAELVAWLASDAASLAQGGFYPLDGGWLAR